MKRGLSFNPFKKSKTDEEKLAEARKNLSHWRKITAEDAKIISRLGNDNDVELLSEHLERLSNKETAKFAKSLLEDSYKHDKARNGAFNRLPGEYLHAHWNELNSEKEKFLQDSKKTNKSATYRALHDEVTEAQNKIEKINKIGNTLQLHVDEQLKKVQKSSDAKYLNKTKDRAKKINSVVNLQDTFELEKKKKEEEATIRKQEAASKKGINSSSSGSKTGIKAGNQTTPESTRVSPGSSQFGTDSTRSSRYGSGSTSDNSEGSSKSKNDRSFGRNSSGSHSSLHKSSTEERAKVKAQNVKGSSYETGKTSNDSDGSNEGSRRSHRMVSFSDLVESDNLKEDSRSSSSSDSESSRFESSPTSVLPKKSNGDVDGDRYNSKFEMEGDSDPKRYSKGKWHVPRPIQLFQPQPRWIVHS